MCACILIGRTGGATRAFRFSNETWNAKMNVLMLIETSFRGQDLPRSERWWRGCMCVYYTCQDTRKNCLFLLFYSLCQRKWVSKFYLIFFIFKYVLYFLEVQLLVVALWASSFFVVNILIKCRIRRRTCSALSLPPTLWPGLSARPPIVPQSHGDAWQVYLSDRIGIAEGKNTGHGLRQP